MGFTFTTSHKIIITATFKKDIHPTKNYNLLHCNRGMMHGTDVTILSWLYVLTNVSEKGKKFNLKMNIKLKVGSYGL